MLAFHCVHPGSLAIYISHVFLFDKLLNLVDQELSYVMMMNISTVNCLRNYTRKMYNEAELGTWSLRSKTSFHVDQAEKQINNVLKLAQNKLRVSNRD